MVTEKSRTSASTLTTCFYAGTPRSHNDKSHEIAILNLFIQKCVLENSITHMKKPPAPMAPAANEKYRFVLLIQETAQFA